MNIQLPEAKEVYQEYVRLSEGEVLKEKDERTFLSIWNSLTDLEKKILYLHNVKGLSYEEVAKEVLP